jgi:hypothetical protein
MLKGSQQQARPANAIGNASADVKARVDEFNEEERSAIAKKAAAGRWG